MKAKPDFLQDRAKARRVRDESIAELRICYMAAGLQAVLISVSVGLASYGASPIAPAISVFAALAVLVFATWSLVNICRYGILLRASIAAMGLFLEGRHAEAVKLFDSAKGESA